MDLTTGVAVSARHPVHEVLAAHTGVEAGQLLVDLGCGHGITLAAVAACTPGAVLVGIDIAVDSLVSAAGLLGGAALLACADLSRPLPLPDATVDVIVCHNVMELLVDPAVLFTEIGRVLRAGGRSFRMPTSPAWLSTVPSRCLRYGSSTPTRTCRSRGWPTSTRTPPVGSPGWRGELA